MKIKKNKKSSWIVFVFVGILLIGALCLLVPESSSGGGGSGGGVVGGGSSNVETEICAEHTYGDVIVVSEFSCNTPGETKQICEICGYENVTRIEANHTSLVSVNYEAISSERHLIQCLLCEEYIDEVEHTLEEQATYNDPEQHRYDCKLCGTDAVYETHTFDDVTGSCTVCGYVREE